MFAVSETATMAIRTLMGRADVPQGAGMRIVADADRSSLQIGVSPAPEPGDTVLDVGGDARLFIAEDAGELLENKLIDAQEDESGRLQFVLDTRQS